MASCLFECLCEADLEKYYPHFMAVGLQRIEELARITMKDYSTLGVHNMEDRKRLFQLIKIIQSVSEEDRTPLQPGCVYLQPAASRSATRRQLQFDSSLEMERGAFSPPQFCSLSHACCPNPPGPTDPPAEPHHARKVPPTELHDDSPYAAKTPKAGKGPAAGIGDSEVPVVHRVTHVSGYNYGVPQTCLRSGASEKESPWTQTEKIRVCVRKRPLGLREERRGEANVVTVENNETISIYERKEAVNLKEYVLQHVFYFDEVFSEKLSNQDVYLKTAHPLIQHVLNGGNATCFAYGQTGAGKTFTMIGTPKSPGLYALAAEDIFEHLDSSRARSERCVWISFYEIYCGQLYDLLNGRKRLFAREDGKHVVQIVGLREVQVRNVDLLLEIILKGSKERSTGATGVNSDSSRSHAVIQIQLKDAGNRKLGRISFIDLAGSERASDSRESDKQTKMEGAEINQSLLALKECIRALDQEQAHTPFRQSKLTQVLKDSFIGNSKTCMIANVSPSHVATEHTLNTLRYADRVKELRKGIKCATSCGSRTRAACPSPKRVQNSSSMLGEKISPKKVKLGSQTTSTSNKVKAKQCSSVFHPTNGPLSSTPKTHNKANGWKENPGQAWLNHATPGKGAVRPGNAGKKKSENQANNKNSIESKTEIRSELKGSEVTGNPSWSQQRIQAVHPVQKPAVPSTGVSFRGQNSQITSYEDESALYKDPETDSGCWGTKYPQQTDREQHLRSFHQQFQHPPIHQQNLRYQPLEKGALLEDLDDSDFSEDSFSYSATRKKGRKEETVRERLSFFLHQRSPGAEATEPKDEPGDSTFNLSQEFTRVCGWTCGNSSASLKHQAERVDNEQPYFWSSGEDSFSVRNSSTISNIPEKPYFSQEDLTGRLKKPTNQPWAHNLIQSIGVLPSDLSSLPQESDQSVSIKATEETGENVEDASERNDGRYDHQSALHESSSGPMPPLTASLLQDNWSVELMRGFGTMGSSERSGDVSKNLGSDKAWTGGADLDPANSSADDKSVGRNIFDFVQQVLQRDGSVDLDKARQVCGGSDSRSGGSSRLSLGQEFRDKISTLEANLSLSPVSRSSDTLSRGSSLDCARRGEPPGVLHYDADTEESQVKMKAAENTPERNEKCKSRCREDSGDRKRASDVSPENTHRSVTNSNPESSSPAGPGGLPPSGRHSGDLERKSSKVPFDLDFRESDLEDLKSTFMKCTRRGTREERNPYCAAITGSPRNAAAENSHAQPADAPNPPARPLDKAQELVVRAHREQLDDVAALCSREELLLSQVTNSDFKEYVAKLNELLVLKWKCIHGMRAQLQLFMACPRSGASTDRAGSPQQPL
ncbi:kinesin-like protein KIF24 [Spea bombifrons]|uniref:kinesin-like protein KIF24 n=1 Tax=Spea bombifrons TaxID=233779 RepID=UPI00234BBDD5|nr:kinesin-like protein KIF24 [Spea bombifrons]